MSAKITVIMEPGTAKEYKTGSWRSKRPVVDKEKCINCMFCWMYCPDNSILVEGGEMKGIKLSHCKGCGICANQCPKNAIVMVEEGEQ
ncbi:MAG: 4Fe-4S binding protein [Methanomassiliicoccus sp.]|nr:4Fe-4S binding protein [Methanomassiliicoccus sp.]